MLAKRRTSQALVVLLKAQPNRALLVEPGGVSGTSSESESVCEVSGRWKEREIEAMLVEPGDVLRVLPGAKVRGVYGIYWMRRARFHQFLDIPLRCPAIMYDPRKKMLRSFVMPPEWLFIESSARGILGYHAGFTAMRIDVLAYTSISCRTPWW